jgi:hypothetical protein
MRYLLKRIFTCAIIMPALLIAAEKKTSTQVSQANNLSSLDYGLFLSVPNFLERNVDDDQQPTDENGHYEKWDLDHQPSAGEDDVLEVTISAKALPSGGTVTLTIEGEVDAIVSPLKIRGLEVIYWTDQVKTDRYHKENHRQITWQLPSEGDSNGILNEVMYIEGVKVTTVAKAIKFTAVLKTGGHTVTVVKDTGVFECDADVDSLNDHEFEFTGFDKSEDQIEKSELKITETGPKKPGKFITNTSNANYDDDQITDYADGFGLVEASGSNPANVSTDLKFTPVEIKLKKPYTKDAYVTISYGSVSMPKLSSEGLAKHGDGSKLRPYAYTANKGGLRIWNVKPDKRAGGNKQAGEGGNFIYPGKIYKWTDINKTLGASTDENVIETAQLFVEYVEAYPSQAHGKREITVSITEDDVTTTDKFTVTLLPVTLAVDNNRDGYVMYGDYRDHTHKNQEYRFWVNNDSDQNGGDTSQPETDNPWSAATPDCNIGGIGHTCQRNLEDFTRLHMQLEPNPIWYRSHGVTVKLKWQKNYSTEQPEIRLYETFENDGGRKYLNDDASSLIQTYEPALPKLGASDSPIPENIINTDGTIYMIYEGVKEGKGRVAAELIYEGKKIGEVGALYLDIEDIRDMYEQKRIQESADFPGPDNATYSAPTGVTSVDDPRGSALEIAWDEDTDNKSYTICVHGWDKTWNSARSDEQTVFKRMWQRGFKGRYIGFYWPTKTGKTTFNHSEYIAWNCGLAFKGLIDSLPSDYKKNVIAHSMGNIVIGSALAQGADVQNYAILNSAVPAQCYDPSATLEASRGQLFDPTIYFPWLPPTPIPYVAWDENELSSDPVFGSLGYKGKVPITSANLINYYLANDEATVNAWEANQWADELDSIPTLDTKPVDGYEYVYGTSLEYNPFGPGRRTLSSSFEVMSMVNRSRTKSAGSGIIRDTAPSAINKNIDLAGFGFGAPGAGNNLLHECVFSRRICKAWSFYESLLEELGYVPMP